METVHVHVHVQIWFVSLLAREINWMETSKSSLGVANQRWPSTLYSLEKLIEWKLESFNQTVTTVQCNSLLAREINWMETERFPSNHSLNSFISLLAREINWMETGSIRVILYVMVSLYSLEKLIEWKHDFCFPVCFDLCFSLYSLEKLIEWKRLSTASDINLLKASSLLAREINWMETCLFKNLVNEVDTLYSLEKLIEWKPLFNFILNLH